MTVEAGTMVTIRHYSMINVFKSSITSIEGNRAEVKLPKECQKAEFLRGDPLVIAYYGEESSRIVGARILEYRKAEEALVYIEDDPDEGSRMRSYERFPVSLYADYRVVEEQGRRKCFALVKDISEYGVMIYSSESHFKGLRLAMDIYLTRDILSLTAEIVRKTEYEGYYEYGLKIRHSGPVVFNHIKNYVKKSQNELLPQLTK
ncbi:MAG TPA: PilZ domain-containing protein [Clostridia bacterium]|nr:PilZ domain-containing protein [Clostridia bacterium]